MALPPGFLDELRARVPLSEVVGRRVTWDRRKSIPAKGDYWACCPFHQEKSPSFHVDDRQGFYYCFGCHAKGDAIAFLRERENMSFMDAVEELARSAGLAMPAQDPRAAAEAEKRRGLADWMEAAVRFYRAGLVAPKADAARRYLDRRRVGAEARDRFELGFAAPERRALTAHLQAAGASVDDLEAAGLSIRPEDGGPPFDRFRDRIMFPIRDARGRCIAFGGRAMSADAPAKYLNSPETALFDKSRTLYNVGPARGAAGKAGALIVAEGYMDVIALVEAGFAHAVAPLGTAVTEHHLDQIWKIADEPVIALDGDAAGRRAAMRVIDLALPLLTAGRSLRIALLPEGRDPDDLIRAEGPAAMRAVLDAAEPMVALLWRRETEGRVLDSPERRAALDARLRALVARVGDPAVREHYRAAFAERRAALFRPAAAPSAGPARHGARAPGRPGWGLAGSGPAGPGRAGRGAAAPEGPRPETRASALARGARPPDDTRPLEAAILLALLRRPELLERWGEDVAAAEFRHRDLDDLRGALLSAASGDATPPANLREDLRAALGFDPEAALRGSAQTAEMMLAGREAASEAIEAGFLDALARLHAAASLRREIAEAEAGLAAGPEAAGPAVAGLDDRIRRAVETALREAPGRLPEDRAEDGEPPSALLARMDFRRRRDRRRDE
jgi:DNA primase